MAETATPVQTFEVDYTCDKCGNGKMRPTGVALLSHPARYPHRCDSCDAHQNFDKTYPAVIIRKA